MDIGAYAQMESLSDILAATGIEIPRLRGFRLMAEEEKISEKEIKEMIEDTETDVIEDLVRSCPPWSTDSDCHEYSSNTDRRLKKYVTYGVNERGYQHITGIRWENIHGKKRKTAKFEIKKRAKRIRQSMETFNKYVGRKDVLYVHARIGGGNWMYFHGPEVARHPAFIERVDDWFDSTYCDIYVKVDEKVVEEYLKKEKAREKEAEESKEAGE